MTRRPAAAPTPTAPARWATAGAGLAVRALPAGDMRQRYREEIRAELFGMPRSRQATHVLGVLASAWSLRTALTRRVDMEKGKIMDAPRKPLGCRLNMHHVWRSRSTEDGSRYRACIRCGKLQDISSMPPGGAMAGIGGGA